MLEKIKQVKLGEYEALTCFISEHFLKNQVISFTSSERFVELMSLCMNY